MGRHLTNSGLVLPVIRKVISRDDHHICSICRTEYKSKVEANNCLNHCWYEVQELYPVVLRKLHGRFVVFRCHFCCRDYKDESDALSCARRCMGDRSKLHVHEQLLNDLPIEAPTQRPSRLRLVALKTVPVRPLNKHKVDDRVDHPTGHRTEHPANDDTPDIEIPAEKDPTGPRRTRADFPKPWVRMDAKYQCSCCKKLLYTKMEIEACFNSHFDDEGFEKPAVD